MSQFINAGSAYVPDRRCGSEGIKRGDGELDDNIGCCCCRRRHETCRIQLRSSRNKHEAGAMNAVGLKGRAHCLEIKRIGGRSLTGGGFERTGLKQQDAVVNAHD